MRMTGLAVIWMWMSLVFGGVVAFSESAQHGAESGVEKYEVQRRGRNSY